MAIVPLPQKEKTPMKLLSLSASIFTLGVLCAPQASAQEVTLKPTWHGGKVYRQSQDMEMTTALPGAAGEQKMQMHMEMSSKVTAEGEDKVVTMVIDVVAMEMSMMGTKMSFDSREEGGAGPLAAMKGMIGKEVVAVFGADDSFKELRELPEIPGLGDANPFGSEETVKNMMGEAMRAAFPDKPVSPGDSWEGDLGMDLGKMGKLSIATEFDFEKLEEIEGAPQAKLNFSGIIKGKMEAGPGVEVVFGEGSKQEGTVYFDPKIGMATKMEMNSTVNMEVLGNKMPMKQKIVQKLTAFEDIEE